MSDTFSWHRRTRTIFVFAGQISGDLNLGGEGVRPKDHLGIQAMRLRLRHPAGAGSQLRVRRQRLELREEQQEVSTTSPRLTTPHHTPQCHRARSRDRNRHCNRAARQRNTTQRNSATHRARSRNSTVLVRVAG